MDPGWKNYGWFYSGSICKDEFTEIMRIEKWKRQYKICCNGVKDQYDAVIIDCISCV
jgi:hypothetical protein